MGHSKIFDQKKKRFLVPEQQARCSRLLRVRTEVSMARATRSATQPLARGLAEPNKLLGTREHRYLALHLESAMAAAGAGVPIRTAAKEHGDIPKSTLARYVKAAASGEPRAPGEHHYQRLLSDEQELHFLTILYVA